MYKLARVPSVLSFGHLQSSVVQPCDDYHVKQVKHVHRFLSLHSPSLSRETLRDQFLTLRDRFWPCEINFWPCEIEFGLARSIFGLARSILALRDQFLALRDRFWPCEVVYVIKHLCLIEIAPLRTPKFEDTITKMGVSYTVGQCLITV